MIHYVAIIGLYIFIHELYITLCIAISKTDQVSMTSSSYYDSTQDSTLTITIDSTMSHSLFQLTSSSTDPSPHTHATTSTSRTIVDHLPSTSVATSSHTPSISSK